MSDGSPEEQFNELLGALEALHGMFLGHAVHTRNAGAVEENGRAQALAWESAAASVWRVYYKYDRLEVPHAAEGHSE